VPSGPKYRLRELLGRQSDRPFEYNFEKKRHKDRQLNVAKWLETPWTVHAYLGKQDSAKKSGCVEANEELPPSTPIFLAVADIATLICQPVNRVENFLRRFRLKRPDCFVKLVHRRKNEPQYLYRVRDVWPVLQERLKNWRRKTND
jgi:hypothetical protein